MKFVKLLWVTVFAALMVVSAVQAKDFALVVDREAQYFDLDRSRVAVGFSSAVAQTQKLELLGRFAEIESSAMLREETVQRMTVVNLVPGISDTGLESLLLQLEASPEVAWAAPILTFDGLEHIPGPNGYIQFAGEVTDGAARAILQEYGFSVLRRCDDWADNVYWIARQKGTAWSFMDVCAELAAKSEVEWAEPDFIRQFRLHTNDTFYGSQWFLNQGSDADIDAPEAWTYTTGSASVSVAISDIGVQISHPDLNDHILSGYDAETGDSDPSPTGDDGHGTCCAGLASAETNNSLGVAGVGYNCRIRGVKIGHTSGGFIITDDTKIVNSINFSRDNSQVMSNSWGGGSSSSAINTALTNARTAGLTILFSSGNSNGAVQYPATQTSVIAVGATAEDDDRCTPADWGGGQGSCFGAQLDVVAPGNNQYATDMTGGNGYSGTDYYAFFGGTSGACPVAAGVCALIKSVDISLTPAQVQQCLQNTADDLVGAAGEDVAGWDQYMGYGRVNANDAVRYVFGPASNLSATSGLVNVPMSWSQPWRVPNSYDVYRSTTGQFGTYGLIGSSFSTNFTDNAVTGGFTYWYKVKAVYTNGVSDFSNAASGTPVVAYLPPQSLVANGGQNNQVPVSWLAPASGSPTSYNLYRSSTGEFGAYSVQANVLAPMVDWTDFGAVNGNIYWYKATAVYAGPNESGFSNADSALPAAPPNTPPLLTHNALDDFVPGTGVVTALASDNGGVSSVKMFYRLAGGGTFDSLTLSPTGNPQEYSAGLAFLAAGSYEYYVRAADGQGLITTVPNGAPTTLYTFDVRSLCGTEIAYDDGIPDLYNFASDAVGVGMQWAVKFGPVTPSYVLCGARFAAAKTKPDTVHTPVYYAVYLADGPSGLPGTLVHDGTTGSIGNDVGGFPAGTAWAQILIRDALNTPLQINASEFYVAVGNTDTDKLEAFAHDQSVPNNHRSYVFDSCDLLWLSEDAVDSAARPGNRMIRVQGFSLIAPNVVIMRSGSDVRLDWNSTGAPSYDVYSATTEAGPFTTYEGSTATTTFIDLNAVNTGAIRFYLVKSVVN